jgi:hypothetical protein
LRKTDYLNFLRSLGKKIYGRRWLQRKEYTLGFKADHTQRKRAIWCHQTIGLWVPFHEQTNILANRRKKIPDLLDFLSQKKIY